MSRSEKSLPPMVENAANVMVRQQSQIVFMRLDPVLKSLLQEVTAIKEFFEKASSFVGTVSDEGWFRLVDSCVLHLDVLSRQIRSFGVTFLPSMVLFANYITLPLTAILHLKLPEQVQKMNSRTSPSVQSQRNIGIQRSYLQKLLSSTAGAIQSYVEECSIPKDNLTNDELDERDAGLTTLLGEKYLIKYLIALTTSLPTSSEMERLYCSTDRKDEVEEREQMNKNVLYSQGSSLDDGSEMWEAILKATSSVAARCSGSTLVDAMNGTLLVRLVDCAIAFLIDADNTKVHTGFVFSSSVQLAAIDQMKKLLLKTPTATSFWQSVFPGVLSPLYKRILVTTSLPHNTKISSKKGMEDSLHGIPLQTTSIESIVLLLQNTMVNWPHDEKIDRPVEQGQPSPATKSMSTALFTLAHRSNKEYSNATSKEGLVSVDYSTSSFVTRVRERAAVPLSVILTQKSVSRSENIRKSVLSLCHTILFETRNCWVSCTSREGRGRGVDQFSTLKEVAFEISMTLQQDLKDDVSQRATNIVKNYVSELQEAESKEANSSHSWMMKRLVEITEGLPVLLVKGKKVDISVDLKKLIGYSGCLKDGIDKSLCTSASFQKALSQFMEVDLEFSVGSIRATLVKDSNASAMKLRWLDSDLTSLARCAVRSLGESFGPKHSALLIDAFVSTFYEATVLSPNQSRPHLECLKESFGCLVAARELLFGAFAICNGVTMIQRPKSANSAHILESLGMSVLPLIVSSNFVWSRPPSNENANKNGEAKAPKALMAQDAVAAMLLELVQAFCILLTPNALDKALSTILYPVVEMASQTEFDTAQGAALRVLESAGHTLGRKDVDHMVHSEAQSLVAAMLGSLRLPGGIVRPSTHDVRDLPNVARALRWTLDSLSRAGRDSRNGDETAQISMLVDLMSILEENFDHAFYQKLLSETAVDSLCALHKSFFEYALVCFGAANDTSYSYGARDIAFPSQPSWLDTLDNFREASAIDLREETDPQRRNLEAGKLRLRTLQVTDKDIHLFSKIICRNCYLLSSPVLRIKIASSRGLVASFRFLAFVGSVHEDSKEEQSTVRNSVLRQVAASWPTIKARLRLLSEEFQSEESRNISFVVSEQYLPSATIDDCSSELAYKRIFLASLFDLIAFLCECSGDFMADRLRHTVFPVMATWIRHFIHRLRPQSHAEALRKSISSLEEAALTKFPCTNELEWSESERQLFISILRCITRVMQQVDCGKALTSTLPKTGQMLLVFLEIRNDVEVVAAVMKSLKSMLRIDCGLLRRPLLELSGRGIRQCPLPYFDAGLDSSGNVRLDVFSCTETTLLDPRLGTPYEELLSFAESLPEQSVF